MGSKKAKPTIVNNTSTNAPPPEIMAQYNALIARANDVASTPYQAYDGQLSAGWNADQQAATNAITRALGTSSSIDDTLRALSQSAGGVGNTFAGYAGQAGGIGDSFTGLAGQAGAVGTQFGGLAGQAGAIGSDIAANSNVYRPYYSSAGNLTTQGAAAYRPTDFSASELAKYMSPYTQNVIDTTLANVNQNNALQQKTVLSDAIKSGNAFGGDRAGLAQAELVRNQNLSRDQIIAGLTNQNYAQALGQFNAQQAIGLSADQNNAARALQAGAQMGQLGTGAQNAALSGRTAQLAALASQGQLTSQQLAALAAEGQLTGQQLEALKTSGAMSAQQLAALAQQGQNEGQRITNNNSQGALAQQQLAAGTLQQQTDQQALDRLYQQYANETSFPYQQTGWLGNLVLGLGSNSGGTTTGQSTQIGGQAASNGTGQIIGGALSLAAALPWSDERVKDDIKRIGETYDGQPLYSFRYKGDPITHVGLMAQEVEKQTPDAVVEMDGIKRVDYAAATKDAADRGRFAYGGSIPGQNVATLIPELNMPVGRTMPNASAPGVSAPAQAPDNSKQFQDIGKSAGDLLKKSGLFNSPLSLTGDTAASAVGTVSSPIASSVMGLFGQSYAFGGEVEAPPRLPSFADPTVVSPEVLAALRAEREAAKAEPMPGLGFEPAKAMPIGGLGAAMMTGEPATGLGSAAFNDNAEMRPAASGLAGAPPTPTYTAFTPSARDPRGIRNNNAGNIEAGDFTKRQPGFVGSDGRFATFDAPENGIRAADRLLQIYHDKHGLNTIAGIVNRWAPPSDNNPTNAYAAAVARHVGVDPNDPVAMGDPNVRRKIVEAKIAFENGRDPYSADIYDRAYSGAPVTASSFAPAAPGLGGAPASRAISSGLRDTGSGLSGAGIDQPRAQPVAEDKGLFGTGFKLSDEARQGLMAAGLAMMASRSSNLGQMIGEGGLAGLGAYQGAKSGLGKAAIEQAQLENLRSTTRGRDAEVALKARALEQRAEAARRAATILGPAPAAAVTAAGTPAAAINAAPVAINPVPVAPSAPVAPSGVAPEAVEAAPAPVVPGSAAPAPVAAPARQAAAAEEYPVLDPQWDPAKLTAAAAAIADVDADTAKAYRDRAAQIVKEGVSLSPDGKRVALPDVKSDPIERETKAVQLEKLKRDMQGKQFKSLVSPEDRAAAGVAPDYKGTVQIDRDGQLHYPGKPATEVNIDNKGAGKFAEKGNEIAAKRYGDMVTAADDAAPMRADVETLAGLLEGVGTGAGTETRAGLANMAKSMGLDSVADRLAGGKLDELQAAQALLDKITPRMRVPGSGTSSDRDMAAFKNSLPSLGKQPGGNRMIADTFRALADYQVNIGDIASQALRGEIKQVDADRMIRETPSPFALFKEFQKSGTKPNDGKTAAKADEVKAEKPAMAAPKAGDVMDGYRFKGGNPSDQSAWEKVN